MQYFVDNASSTQILLFLTVMILGWVTEKAVFSQSFFTKTKHSALNFMFILTALPIQFLMTLICLRTSQWVNEVHWGLLYLLPYYDSPWLKYGLMFFALDFLDYCYHFTMHRSATFWRFHRVHHMDPVLDVTTTVREHPGETFIRTGYLVLWVFITGASIEALILRQSVGTIANILSHTSFRLPPKPARVLGWLFITPNLHHTHHHFKLPASNYGDVFSIWDRLLGSFKYMSGAEIVFGIEDRAPIRDRAARMLLADRIRPPPLPQNSVVSP